VALTAKTATAARGTSHSRRHGRNEFGPARQQKNLPCFHGRFKNSRSKEFRFDYAFFILRRTTPARLTKPVPSRVREPGSGTTILVSPLEIWVEPLKKPLPVLMVSCTVTPLLLKPLVPDNTPVRT